MIAQLKDNRLYAQYRRREAVDAQSPDDSALAVLPLDVISRVLVYLPSKHTARAETRSRRRRGQDEAAPRKADRSPGSGSRRNDATRQGHASPRHDAARPRVNPSGS